MKVLKWIIGIAMAFVLMSGLSLVSTSVASQKMRPHSLDDLGIVRVTIKSISLQPAGVSGAQVLAPRQYFTKFVVANAPAAAEAVDTAALAGQAADVYLSQKDAAMLKAGRQGLPPAMLAYGIVLASGKTLSNPAAVLAQGDNVMLHTYMGMILVPVFYFLGLFFFGGAPRRRGPVAEKRQ
ncbi:MAG: hypothetical protein KGL10_02475 [Alphaproteobacteria bacterium]|nr:hypothetical protein [Alphaproteobacteria bacterium]MDE2336154.1 hypothetical protein [Alphaproteobacteria bacterium]